MSAVADGFDKSEEAGKALAKLAEESTQRCRFPMGSCGMARGSSPKDSRVSRRTGSRTAVYSK